MKNDSKMCLFRNKGIFGIKLSIIEKWVSEEFWRGANSPTLLYIVLAVCFTLKPLTDSGD